jgi:lipopolysaccharide/colanic/teichoic acid biosynthesis glycosyltransferase
MIAQAVKQIKSGRLDIQLDPEKVPDFSAMTDQDIAVWYNDNVIYPDKVRLNCHYYRNYSFVKDIQMIFATVLGKRIWYAGEQI